MNRNVALALVAIVLVIGVVLYFNGTSEVPSESDGVSETAESPTPADEPVGAVPEAQQQPGVVYDENGIAIGGVEPRPHGNPLNIDNIIEYHERHVIVSNDSRDTFTVPLPGDDEWADYLEMRRAFPSMNDNSEGYVRAYDPEWRSVLKGYREVPEPGMELFGGAGTLRELVEMVIDEVKDGNQIGLVDLALRKEEFEIICWPSFPQARPYTLAFWEDAWRFHYANLISGSKEGIDQLKGRNIVLDSIAYGEIEDFQHFELYNDMLIRVKDLDTGETLEIEWVNSIIERNGIFKVFLYKN